MDSLSKGFQDPRYRDLIGALVRQRKSIGFSQETLAGRLSKHQQFVSRYETGERRLDVIEFIDIARALGLDVSEVIRRVS